MVSRLLCSYNRVEELGSGFCRGPVRICEGHEHHAAAVGRDGTVVVWGHKACGLERPPPSPTRPQRNHAVGGGGGGGAGEHGGGAGADRLQEQDTGSSPQRGPSGSEFGERPVALHWLAEWLQARHDWAVDVHAGHDVMLLRTARHRLLLLEPERGFAGLRTWLSPTPLTDAACASWQPLALSADGLVSELIRPPQYMHGLLHRNAGELQLARQHSSASCIHGGEPGVRTPIQPPPPPPPHRSAVVESGLDLARGCRDWIAGRGPLPLKPGALNTCSSSG